MGKQLSSISFVKQFAQVGIGTVVTLLIGLLTTPIITRLVDPETYGQFSLFNTYSSIAMIVLCVGLDQALVRYYYKGTSLDYRKGIFRECFFMPFLNTLGFSIVLIVLTLLFDSADEFGFLQPVIVGLFVLNVWMLLFNRFGLLVLRLNYRTGAYSVLNVLHKASYIIFVLVLIAVFQSHFLILTITATILSVLITVICSMIMERRVWFGKAKKRVPVSRKEIVLFGAPLMISGSVFLIFQATDKIVLSMFCDMTNVGVYSSAQSIMAVFSVIQTTFNTVWAPRAVEHYEKHPSDRLFYQRMNQMLTVVMFLFGATVLVFKDVIVLLLGEEYRAAAYIIPFLMLSPMMYTVSESTVTGLTFTGKTQYQMVATVLSCIANIIGNVILIPMLGPTGAAVSTGFSYVLFFALRTCFANRFFYVDFKLKKFAIVMVLFLAFASYNTLNPVNWADLVLYFIFISVCSFVYRNALTDVRNVIKKQLGR